jgi:hypothetical protein
MSGRLTTAIVLSPILALSVSLFACGGGDGGDSAATVDETAGMAAGDSPREPSDEELRTSLPELAEFHEVIFQLWHEAWPNHDYETMIALLPTVREHVGILQDVELPGIVREEQEGWDAGMERLTESLALYETAAETGDEEGLLAAVEQLHAAFENLVRILRPVLDELEAYHVELYRVYHYYMPDRNLLELRLTTARMLDRCAALLTASPPPDSGVEPGLFTAEVERLCEATEELQGTTEGEDWTAIDGAVERVHQRYRTIVEMFD